MKSRIWLQKSKKKKKKKKLKTPNPQPNREQRKGIYNLQPIFETSLCNYIATHMSIPLWFALKFRAKLSYCYVFGGCKFRKKIQNTRSPYLLEEFNHFKYNTANVYYLTRRIKTKTITYETESNPYIRHHLVAQDLGRHSLAVANLAASSEAFAYSVLAAMLASRAY